MADVLALRPVTGCGHCEDAFVGCLFFAADVDVDEEAAENEARRSSAENIAMDAH